MTDVYNSGLPGGDKVVDIYVSELINDTDNQTISGQKTFENGLALIDTNIRLSNYLDSSHYIKHFTDDTDGFGVSTGFTVKHYSSEANLFRVDMSGNAVASGNLYTNQVLYSNTLTGNQIIHASGTSMHIGNSYIASYYLETGNAELYHLKAGSIKKIWTEHNFNPNSYTVAYAGNTLTLTRPDGSESTATINAGSGVSFTGSGSDSGSLALRKSDGTLAYHTGIVS